LPRETDSRSQQHDGQTVLGPPLADLLLLLAGLPAVLALIGGLLPVLSRWLLSLEVALPLRPVLRFAGAVDQPWEIAINGAVWLIAGLMLGFTAMGESVTLTVSDTQLQVTKDSQTNVVARADAATVYADGKEFVVLDGKSRQLLRETPAAPMTAVANAFTRHRFPWRDSDPYAELFRLWSLGTGDLPDAVNSILSARQAALRNKSTQEVADLRDAVQKLGYVVRDEDNRQYWRPLVRS
jgi:hypothetical protein